MPADLTVEHLKSELDYNPETGEFTKKSTGKRAGNMGALGYWVVGICGKQYYAHRLAWFFVHGRWPKMVDHINCDKSDNRLANLREATSAANNQNRRIANKNNISGYLGVSYDPRNASPWVARIWIDGRSKHLGACKTKDEAHRLYVEAKRRIHEGCTL